MRIRKRKSAALPLSTGHKILNLGCKYQYLFVYPGGDALVHALLEGGAEGAVTVVAALLGQLLGDNGLMCSGKLAVAGYEMRKRACFAVTTFLL